MTVLFPNIPRGTKCSRCRSEAHICLPSHNCSFCSDCYEHYFRTAVSRAMKKFRLPQDMPLMVAVSGGKDSLAVWSVLHDLGYKTKGVHIYLGIDRFSDASEECISRFAGPRNLPWTRYSLKDLLGYTIPEIDRRIRRKTCSVCGLLKRQSLNRLAVREGFACIVSGHNLDDEAGRLLGNLIRHRKQYFEKQYPFLPSNHPRMPAKAKPLYRLEAEEILAYCKMKGLVPVEEQCPLSKGATSHAFREALDFLEDKMPGTKRSFFFTYLRERKPSKEEFTYGVCRTCGEPAYADRCSVCNLLDQLHSAKPFKASAD